MIIYYVAKYALANGKITQMKTAATPDEDGDLMEDYTMYRVGRDIFLAPEDAAAAADKLRLKKIASLKKQIARLEAMKF